MLDRVHHQVPNMVAADPTGGGYEAHGLAITAIEGEGNSDTLAIIAADLKSIGAPAAVSLIDGDPSVMAPFLTSGVALQEQPVVTHDTPDPFVVWRRWASSGRGVAPRNGVDAAIAVCRHLGDDGLDLGQQGVIGLRRPPPPSRGARLHSVHEV
jgi:hypothetical protein